MRNVSALLVFCLRSSFWNIDQHERRVGQVLLFVCECPSLDLFSVFWQSTIIDQKMTKTELKEMFNVVVGQQVFPQSLLSNGTRDSFRLLNKDERGLEHHKTNILSRRIDRSKFEAQYPSVIISDRQWNTFILFLQNQLVISSG